MPITVSWQNKAQDIILVTYTGEWTQDDYAVSRAEVYTLLDQVPHPAAVFIDLARTRSMPAGDMLLFLRQAMQNGHPGIDRLVIVGANELFLMITNVIRRTYPELMRKYHFAGTLPEARRLLAELRQQREASADASAQR